MRVAGLADESVLKKKPNVKRLEENVERTQEVVGSIDAFENFYNEDGSYKCYACRTGGEKEIYE
ncbi:hypothetical protein AGMMS49936_07510 [Endomicrobiia bacterium]|nr:hypothetical protein AGMMS49936_07510 [Endomicrobiia bacterium]